MPKATEDRTVGCDLSVMLYCQELFLDFYLIHHPLLSFLYGQRQTQCFHQTTNPAHPSVKELSGSKRSRCNFPSRLVVVFSTSSTICIVFFSPWGITLNITITFRTARFVTILVITIYFNSLLACNQYTLLYL